VPRPPVSLIVPFRGSRAHAEALLTSLGALERAPGDEVLIVDNDAGEALAGARSAVGVRLIPATGEHSSYYARNIGAEAASAPWLLFVDADCRPGRGILDAYFDPEPAESCGVVAGSVLALGGQRSLAARYAASRKLFDVTFHLRAGPYPAGITGNLLVRREAWEHLGGFHEGIRSGGDVEFSWRVQEAGWQLEHRPAASVEVAHPDSVRELLAKSARYGAGRRWINRRYRGSMPRPRLARELFRAAAGGLAWPLLGQPRRGAFKLIDGAQVAAGAWGYLTGDNRAPAAAGETPAQGHEVVISTDAFPARSETFVHNEALTLRDLGWSVRVESIARPARVERSVARELPIAYVEDYCPRDAVRDLGWLAARHPLGCLRDLAGRRQWRAEEVVLPLRSLAAVARRAAKAGRPHVHVHFAAGAALAAMRLRMLVGASYSVTGHGYDVFQEPRNLGEKLRRAAFVVAPCEYTAEHLRGSLGRHRDKVVVVVMGVDVERFRRRAPYPGGGTVVAIGRLVEKKGFAYLVEAAARLAASDAFERLVIAGDGPLAQELEDTARRLDVGGAVEFVQAWGPDEVRALIELADVLALPSVIAADGDRDAMPVVVKEALAMEVPVVTTDAVGLPEVVRPEWGTMVPPRDAAALARALSETLALPPDERAAMGAAGRRHVSEHCDLRRETAKLAARIDQIIGVR
jgi:colanic acid/amylovoran biosynthesis glycosyltransferase